MNEDELYHLTDTGFVRARVEITGSRIRVAAREVVFNNDRPYEWGGYGRPYDVSPRGDFVFLKRLSDRTAPLAIIEGFDQVIEAATTERPWPRPLGWIAAHL